MIIGIKGAFPLLNQSVPILSLMIKPFDDQFPAQIEIKEVSDRDVCFAREDMSSGTRGRDANCAVIWSG